MWSYACFLKSLRTKNDIRGLQGFFMLTCAEKRLSTNSKKAVIKEEGDAPPTVAYCLEMMDPGFNCNADGSQDNK